MSFDIIYAYYLFEVNGISLGEWMSKQPKPVKVPNIIKESDNGQMVMVKGLIIRMLAAEPSQRCTIQFVSDNMRLYYGKFC